MLHLSDIDVGPLKAINAPGSTLCTRHDGPNIEWCRIKKTLTLSPFKYIYHSPPLIANRTRTRASTTQCDTGTAPAPHPAPHTPRTVSRRAVVVLRAPATSGLEPDLAERALSSTHIRPAAGPLPRPSTCNSSSAPCPRPITRCAPLKAPPGRSLGRSAAAVTALHRPTRPVACRTQVISSQPTTTSSAPKPVLRSQNYRARPRHDVRGTHTMAGAHPAAVGGRSMPHVPKHAPCAQQPATAAGDESHVSTKVLQQAHMRRSELQISRWAVCGMP